MKILFLFFISVLSLSAYAPTVKNFSYVAENLVGLSNARIETMTDALKLFTKVMNNKQFHNELKGLQFHFDRLDDPNRGSTTRQVVRKIYRGKERYNQINDSIANIYWVVKKKTKPVGSTPTIGYTRPSIKTFYTYSWFLDENKDKIPIIAGHIAHEWSHKLGFMHLAKKHPKRKKTVPYTFGYVIAKHAARLRGVTMTEEELDFEFDCGETNSKL